ncbi:MAG TPA: ComF family protein [Chryseosolibacter sp.]|nr:ComF family protein [Chryseosolibacter sp.]
MNSTAADILNDFVSLFFPRTCAGCDEALVKGETMICTKCIIEMPRANYHLERNNPFYQKLRGRVPLQFVMSFLKFSKSGRVQKILHELKYRNKPALGHKLGSVFGSELARTGYKDMFDIIVPVPLHRIKKANRGYNQSEEFGNGLAEMLEIPCNDDIVQRMSQTSTQTRKSRLGRWENVKDVFALSNVAAVSGKRVLLVDDVVTTGATLEAVCSVLHSHGSAELSVACIAAAQ